MGGTDKILSLNLIIFVLCSHYSNLVSALLSCSIVDRNLNEGLLYGRSICNRGTNSKFVDDLWEFAGAKFCWIFPLLYNDCHGPDHSSCDFSWCNQVHVGPV